MQQPVEWLVEQFVLTEIKEDYYYYYYSNLMSSNHLLAGLPREAVQMALHRSKWRGINGLNSPHEQLVLITKSRDTDRDSCMCSPLVVTVTATAVTAGFMSAGVDLVLSLRRDGE